MGALEELIESEVEDLNEAIVDLVLEIGFSDAMELADIPGDMLKEMLFDINDIFFESERLADGIFNYDMGELPKNLFSLGKNIHSLIVNMNKAKAASEIDDRNNQLKAAAKAMADIFSIFESLFDMVPLSDFFLFPLKLGSAILNNMDRLIDDIVERYFKMAYTLALVVDTEDDLWVNSFLSLCDAAGLRNEEVLKELRIELAEVYFETEIARLSLKFASSSLKDEEEYQELEKKLQKKIDEGEQFVNVRSTVYDFYQSLDYQNWVYDSKLGVVLANGVYLIEKMIAVKPNAQQTPGSIAVSDAAKTSSPLIINLDGDGMETVSIGQGVYFDHNASGFKVKTGWAGKSEGILVRDLNGNGKIDSGKELFGNNTVLKNGKLAANGFIALKELDVNGDGIFDASEAETFGVQIWIDANCNGVSTKSELYTFEELGTESIDLNYEDINIIDANGNVYSQTSTVVKSDGSLVDVIDIWFTRDFAYSQFTEFVAVPPELYALPDVQGSGTVYNLREAIVLDESGELKELVVVFTEETDRDERLKLTNQIMYKWSGETTNLKVIEAFMGEKYTGGTGTNAMAILNKGFEGMSLVIYEYLMWGSHLKDYYIFRGDTVEGKADLTQAANIMLAKLEEDQFAGEKQLADLIANMHTLGILEEVDYSTFREVLNTANPRYGFLADAVEKNNIITTEVSSKVTGLESANAFWILSGDYDIKGGNNDDTYIFMKAFGNNIIEDSGGKNVISLWDGVIPENVIIEQVFANGTTGLFDLEITVNGCDGKLVIKDYKADSGFELLFTDGSSLDVLALLTYNEIWTSQDLELMQLDLNYKLMADIDLSNISWTPIGTKELPYVGIFDGNGFAIRGLNVNQPEADYAGMFGYNQGIIVNLNLEDVKVSGKSYVGSLAGYSQGTIFDCSVTGDSVISGMI